MLAPSSSSPSYSYYGNSSSNEQRKYNRKVHMLNIALSPLISNEPPTSMDVIALTWGANVPVSLGVDGHLDLSEEFNLWTSRGR